MSSYIQLYKRPGLRMPSGSKACFRRCCSCCCSIAKGARTSPSRSPPRNRQAWPLSFGNFNFYQSGGTMCGGAYHPMNGFIHSAFGCANDAKYCNYWINNGTGRLTGEGCPDARMLPFIAGSQPRDSTGCTVKKSAGIVDWFQSLFGRE